MRVREIIIVLLGMYVALGCWASPPENFVLISGGTFIMGSPESEPEREDNELQHQVTITSFYMAKHLVTQEEYEKIMAPATSLFKGDNLPVDYVSWFDAIVYCNKRSQEEGLTPAYTISGSESRWTVNWNRSANGYRLPTEAEWEYACRAGTTTPFSTGDNITTEQANYNGNYPYNDNPEGESRDKTTPVGSFEANPWGLYYMHGNVYEWCWDWYGDYSSESQIDPVGAVSGDYRVLRGGSWRYHGGTLRSAFRYAEKPLNKYNHIGYVGFRLVRNL